METRFEKLRAMALKAAPKPKILSLKKGWVVRWAVLCGFILLHAALTIALRVEAIMTDIHNPCINSTQVCMTEMVKLFLAFVACLLFDARSSVALLLTQLEKAFVEEGADLLKLCVPAVLYTVQNNLQYVIETSPLFVIMYDCKVITTALFYTYMLNRGFSLKEWSTIIALTFGIAAVQSAESDVHYHHASEVVGTLSVILACLTSGFAGVFFEKTLKDSKSSIWMINFQMSMISSSLSMFTCLMEDTEDISKRGFFTGYDKWVVAVIILQGLAGLSIALVVKFSDNIYKGFAAGVSIVMACLIDHYIFSNQVWTGASYAGIILIFGSFSYYSLYLDTFEGEVAAGAPHYAGATPAKPLRADREKEKDVEVGAGVALPLSGRSPLFARPVAHTLGDSTPGADIEPERVPEDADDAKIHVKRWPITEAALGAVSYIVNWFSESDYSGSRARLNSKVGPALD